MVTKHQSYIRLIKLMIIVALILSLGGVLGACEYFFMTDQKSKLPSHSISFFAMNTHMHIEARGVDAEQAVNAGVAEVYRLDALFSRMDTESELYRMNTHHWQEPVAVSEEMFYVLASALYFADLTDGNFDPTVAPLMDLWGFTDGDYRVPNDDDIHQTLEGVGYEKIIIDEQMPSVHLLIDNMGLDLGGIVKGYASDAVLKVLTAYDIETATINLGGNVYVHGQKTNEEPYRVAIADPIEKEGFAGILSVSDMSVITSGGYERYFEYDGVEYIHIMDPHLGKPVQSDLISVTIVDPSGIKGDALSTALFVMGLQHAEAFWHSQGDFGCVLIDDERNYYVSADLKDVFTPREGATVYYWDRGD